MRSLSISLISFSILFNKKTEGEMGETQILSFPYDKDGY